MTDHKSFVFRFGEFEVREQEFLLIKPDGSVAVEPKAFRVLLFLLRNPGRLIKKDEILDAVWSDTAVSDNSLTRSIATLRRVLGDDSREPRYIATVQTIGYRFLCPVTVEDKHPVQAGMTSAATPGIPALLPEAVGHSFRLKWLVLGLTAACVLIVAGWIAWRSMHNRALATSASSLQSEMSRTSHLRIRPLTNLPGSVWAPAFSPDARQIAFFWDGENTGKGDLYVQMVGGGAPLRLTHTRSGFVNAPAWSPDGSQIAFGRCDDNGGGVFVVPALGGSERKLTEVACPYGFVGYPQWTSDAKSMVLQDRCTPGGPMSIVVFSLETGTKQCLTHPPFSQEQGDLAPILSPDQKTVAFLRWPTAGINDIFIVPLAGGEPRRLTADNKSIDAMMWSADGESISFNSNRAGLERTWSVSLAGGVIEPDVLHPGVGALSRDGSKLAYVQPPGRWISSSLIWRADLANAGGAVLSDRCLLPGDSFDAAPQMSPDGREVTFESARSGSVEIWKSKADGSDPLKLTSLNGHAGTPRWSPDGKWIAFDFRPEMHSRLFLIDRQGRNLHMIGSAKGEFENVVPSWSGDQKAIYFASNRSGSYQVWRHELASGVETQLTRNGGFASFESYDGKTLYFSKFDRAGIWSMPVNGGVEERLMDAPHLGYWGHFAVTDSGIYVVDSDADSGPALIFYSFKNRRPDRVLSFKEGLSAIPFAANIGASVDGRTVLFAQSESKSSLVLAEDLR